MIAMRNLVVFSCLFVVAFAAATEEKYTDKYDNINLKEILGNKRLLVAYIDCILEKKGARCTPEGKELKDHLQEALETGCEKCTENQKQGTQTVIEHLIRDEPAIWKELCAKYDPKAIYRKKYEDLAKEKGIEIPK